MDKFNMTVGQAHEFALACARNNLLAEDVKLLSKGDLLKKAMFHLREGPILSQFNEAAYFQNRPGLLIDQLAFNYVEFKKRPTRGLGSLTSYVLPKDSTAIEIFGAPGSRKLVDSMSGVTDFGQIAMLIGLQPEGIEGWLLNDGRSNLFLVLGRNGKPCIVYVEWCRDMDCWRMFFSSCNIGKGVWLTNRQVFSNLH